MATSADQLSRPTGSEPLFRRSRGASSLIVDLRRSRQKQIAISVCLLAPVLLFLGVVFVWPLFSMLYRSVDNPEVAAALPRTVEVIESWDQEELPGEKVYAALAQDLLAASNADRSILGNAARRLNLEVVGFRSLIFGTRSELDELAPPYKEGLIELDPRWGQEKFWRAIQRNQAGITAFYYLSALDMKRNLAGEIVLSDSPLFIPVFIRTIWISALITGICVIFAYPVAYTLATIPARIRSLLMFFVLLPFWTSILVRTSAWFVILQKQGVMNDLLQLTGLTQGPVPLLFSRVGVVMAMVHVMLPFMILPIYGVMKGVNANLVRASHSLGAGTVTTFRRVYFPQTLPGVGAGCVLVFILTLGYYITPKLIGGPTEQLISSFIASYTTDYMNWGLASALASLLLVAVFGLFLIFQKYVRIQGHG